MIIQKQNIDKSLNILDAEIKSLSKFNCIINISCISNFIYNATISYTVGQEPIITASLDHNFIQTEGIGVGLSIYNKNNELTIENRTGGALDLFITGVY